MNMFLNNVLNPPNKIKIGQIWYNNLTKRDFLIIDDKFGKMGVFRSVHLSRVIELNDGNDVLLKSDLYEFYPTDRISLRFTEGPISKNDLNFYLGEISETDLKLVKDSLKISDDSLTDIQRNILAEILEEIEPVRFAALEYFESIFSNLDEEKSDTQIFKISEYLNTEIEPFTYALAAADDSLLNVEQFYELERENREKSFVLINDKNSLIRLSIVKGNLYLVIFAKENEVNIDNVEFTQNDLSFESSDKKLKILPNQMGFISFNLKNYKKEKSKISFKINEKYFEKNFRIE